MSETLARTTITNYRSRLKLLKEVFDKLPETEQARAKAEIAKLEAQLGPLAQAERRPGRPKSRTDIPDEARPKDVRTASKYDEAVATARLKAKQAKLLASLAEVNQDLGEKVEAETEFDKANKFIMEAADAEKAQQGVAGGEQGDGRPGSESERGTSEEDTAETTRR
jgi:hypothetical protein